MIQNTGSGDDLMVESSDGGEHEAQVIDSISIDTNNSQQKTKQVTAVISSQGYIDVLRKSKEKKEAEERKRKERRQLRLESALAKAKQAQMRVEKLQKQVENDKD